MDKEIAKLTKEETDSEEGNRFIQKLNIKSIRTALQELTDNEQSGISHELIKRFVFRVTPTSDTSFDWFIKLGGVRNIRTSYNVEGRQKSRKISLEGIEEIPHTYKTAGQMLDFSKKVHFPLRLPSQVGRSFEILLFEFDIGHEEANAYRKEHSMYVRRSQWDDLHVRVLMETD